MATKVAPVKEEVEQKVQKMYLLSALSLEDCAEKLSDFVKSHGGEVKKVESLGEKELHFPINKHNKLHLASVFFLSVAATIKSIEKELRHEEWLERFLLTDWKGDLEPPKRRTGRPTESKERAEAKESE